MPDRGILDGATLPAFLPHWIGADDPVNAAAVVQVDTGVGSGLRFGSQAPVDGAPLASGLILQSKVTADGHNRFQMTADGTLAWGSGTGVTDATLSRSAAGALAVNNILGFTPSGGSSVGVEMYSQSTGFPNVLIVQTPSGGTGVVGAGRLFASATYGANDDVQRLHVRPSASQTLELVRYEDATGSTNALVDLGGGISLDGVHGVIRAPQNAVALGDKVQFYGGGGTLTGRFGLGLQSNCLFAFCGTNGQLRIGVAAASGDGSSTAVGGVQIGANGYIYMANNASPPAAAAGYGLLYVDGSGHLIYKDPAGTTTTLAT